MGEAPLPLKPQYVNNLEQRIGSLHRNRLRPAVLATALALFCRQRARTTGKWSASCQKNLLVESNPMKTQPAPASSVTWTDLLKKALAGDGDAENRLLEELRPFVKEIIEQRHGGAIPDDPSDVVQDCLVQIWKNLNQVRARDQAGFEAWVRRVAQNGLLDVVRKSQRQVRDVRRQKPLPADLGSTPLGGEQSTGSQNAIAAEEW